VAITQGNEGENDLVPTSAPSAESGRLETRQIMDVVARR
jgi:hypothetical protein